MIEVQKQLGEHIRKALKNLGRSDISAELGPSMDHPKDLAHGDYSTNVALIYAKPLNMPPRDLAEKIVAELKKDSELSKKNLVEKIDIAGPGFINFHLKAEFFQKAVVDIATSSDKGVSFGSNDFFPRIGIKKVIVEYTDPNPFKDFHIGHLMSNAIGESIARIVAFSGAEVKRACYQGDVGLHVAKAVWAYLQDKKRKSLEETDFGKYYVVGSAAYEEDATAKQEIIAINKKIYSKEDPEINAIYEKGRKASLEEFEKIYAKLGTKFDYYFFESETGGIGTDIVMNNLAGAGIQEDTQAGGHIAGKDVFEKSDGAIVFKGDESRGLHTRVFINSEGLPTYEAKELGLAECKYKKYPYDLSVYVTGNEIRDYFKVLLDAIDKTFDDPKIKNIRHIPHGMLRLPSGKMSSRKGGIITAESLIAEVAKLISEKVKDGAAEAAETVAVGAIKYSILRQGSGDDIIFDFGKSISFEGDSGPYLQYSTVRAKSIREKAAGEGIAAHVGEKSATKNEKGENKNPRAFPAEISTLEKLLYRFPEIVERSAEEYEPHYLTTFLVELAAAFNNYYAKNQIVLKSDPASPYKVALTHAFEIVMRNGLHLLGIGVPERM
jgi:arginyl-tRNA synthetase